MSDRNLLTRDHALAVEVLLGTASDRVVVPITNELRKHFGEVRTRQLYPQPYTGSTTGPDWDFLTTVVVTITAVTSLESLRRVVGLIAEDAYEGVRRKLLRAGRGWFERRRIRRAVIIRVGSHRFAFDQSISDEDFQRQLRAAQAIVERSPDELLQPDDPDDEWTPWLWDEESGKWRTSRVRLAQSVGDEPRILS
jgi:hypothetical protein